MADTAREPVLDLLETVWNSMAALGAELDEHDWATPSELPGWTAKDCLSHMAGTERSLLGEPSPEVSVDHLAHVTSPFAAMLEVWVEARRDASGAEVLAEFVDATTRRVAALAAFSEQDWAKVGWSPVGEVPYRTFMEVRVFDCWMHEQDIRRVVGRPGGITAGAELSLDRVGAGLGFVVGKRASAPDGSTIVVEVTGAYPRTFALAVDERAQVLDAAPSDPTVRITTDLEAFCALGGGRWSGQRARAEGRVSITGDLDLGHRIVDGMAITP
jgi:uncharacterized protein (TIGR03083 family)